MTFSGNVESWRLVASILEHVVTKLDIARVSLCEAQQQALAPTSFDSSRVPEITIHDYIARIHQFAECSESCYTIAFIYIDRALMMNPGLKLSMKSVHRLLITCVVLAIKYCDDIYAKNVIYSKIGGLPLQELNYLEDEMLNLLRYNLYVDPLQYLQYTNELERRTQQIMTRVTPHEEIEINNQGKCNYQADITQSTGSIQIFPLTEDMMEA